MRRRRPAARPRPAVATRFGGVRLQDVAAQVGLDFPQDAFRFEATNEPDAMMGGGLCWLDYDDDGWLDLYAVNAYADDEYARWAANGGLPRSALFHNVEGRFVDVSRGSGADLQLRGNGCVAARLQPGRARGPVRHDRRLQRRDDGYDALLWGNGDGTFTEGARAAGINAPGLALGRRGRRRERRRPPGSLRRRLRGRQHADPGLVGRLPVQLRRRAATGST